MYYLFAGDHYYPSGGAGDLKGIFDNIEVCEEYIKSSDERMDWAHAMSSGGGITNLDPYELRKERDDN